MNFRVGGIPSIVRSARNSQPLMRDSTGSQNRSSRMSQQKGVHVVLVGCGAIGSSLVWQLARMPEIARVTLVDPDAYGKSNLRSQFIFPCDLGELKVTGKDELAAQIGF